jgi:hypothetical protein
MKLHTDLVRQILLAVEEFPFDGSFHDVQIEGRRQNEITYHVTLLHEAGMERYLEFDLRISEYDNVSGRMSASWA